LWGVASVAVATAMLTVVASEISEIHAKVVTNHMHARLRAKSVEVDLEYYENAQYQDLLQGLYATLFLTQAQHYQ